MEMQYFVEPGTDEEHFELWKAQRMEWHRGLGLAPERLRFRGGSSGQLALEAGSIAHSCPALVEALQDRVE
jgi:hypothetical protein